jgi:CRISPR-associated endonuclease Cas1
MAVDTSLKLMQITPRRGIITLNGYGISANVDRGHLILKDGVGDERRAGRFARVNHGIRRVVVIGSDGFVSLAAIRWLADQNASFVMLDRDGSVLITTGPVAASDTRLRRAQACAQHSGAAVDIVRELIRLKVSGQTEIAREKLDDADAAALISGFREQLSRAESIDEVRMIEGHAASVYWSAWQRLAIQFPQADLGRIPAHWQTFGTRRSPISGTSRRPPNPVNAILNYLYTLLETETRLAITALGLDPGFGLLHVDHATRDSLVYDLMEPIRPSIDRYVLDWIMRSPVRRSWFFEERDGCCRLMSDLTARLSETAEAWGREVAPIVEWFAQTIASIARETTPVRMPGTRLTQRRRYEGSGAAVRTGKGPAKPQSACTQCGAAVSPGNRFCHACGSTDAVRRLADARTVGKDAARTPQALAKKGRQMTAHRDAIAAWKPSDVPEWLADDVYMAKIHPALAHLSKTTIANTLGVSKDYVYQIVRGDRVPHRRHWLKLAELTGVSG